MRNDDEVEVLSVSRKVFSEALKFYSSRRDKDWGLTDCISFVVMQAHKLTDALTTDNHFDVGKFRGCVSCRKAIL